MKKHIKKLTLILLLLLTSFLGFLLALLLLDGNYDKKLTEELKKVQTKNQQKYIDKEEKEIKEKNEAYAKFFNSLESEVEMQVREKLKSEIDMAYGIAHQRYEKYKKKKRKAEIKEQIQEALSLLNIIDKDSNLLFCDFKGSIYIGQDSKRESIGFRDIDLEMLQKVRKEKEGFIEYTNLKDEKNILYVKELEIYDYFIAKSYNVKTQQELQKRELERVLKKLL